MASVSELPDTRTDSMTRRVLNALRNIIVDVPSEGGVHFHLDGLNGEPSVCYNGRCTRPAADVR
jgi:hypothetical protein